jgi:hypothetical protein
MLNSSIEDDEPLPRHMQARARFPVSPLLIVAVGLLLFLLVLSAGFNVWFFVNPEVHGNRDLDARRAADVARQQQKMQAEDAAQRALVVQQEFQRKQAVLQRDIEDLTRHLEAAKEQLEDAKRKTEK